MTIELKFKVGNDKKEKIERIWNKRFISNS